MQRPMKSDVEEGIDCSGAYLVWEDLTAVIRNDRSSRRLIDGLTGYALPGRITAIMGPSGSGKSTLLDSLAGRVSNNVVLKGSVLLNGRKRRLEYGVVAYVTQENTLLGTLTVRETIWYSAKLRLPSCRSKEEIRDVVEGTIIQMGLSDCADRKIGNWHLRGISGGEKKRVSIALEIVTSPKILFLDEPTTGLDSASAFFVMHTLRQMAQTGKTVVSSVHQPSGEVYSTFDDLCLLSSGEAVYFGEAKLATEFFAQVGFRCPRRRNPSDHFLRCINTDFDSVNESLKQSRRNVSEDSCATSDPLLNMETSIIKNMLIDRFQTSGYSETVRKQIAGISRFEGLSVVYGTGSEAGWWTQLNILIKRSSLNMSRDYGYYWLRIFVYIAVSLCVGTIFFSVGTTYNSILARAASGGFVTGFMTFMSIGGFPSFVEEMKVFQHERLNGYYGVGVYTISNFVSSSPFLLAITVSSGLITYFMVKLHPGISHLLYFLFNLHICMAIIESLMMIVTSMVPNFLMGMVTGAGVIGIMMMTAGFFRLLSDLPKPFWRYPVSYISYGSWALQGQYKNDFLGLEFDAEVKGKPKLTGDYIIKNIYGVSLNHSKWVDLGVLIVLLVSYRLIFFLVLKLQERTKPMMRGIHDRSLLGKTEKMAGSSPSADGTLERNEGDRSRWMMELNTTHH